MIQVLEKSQKYDLIHEPNIRTLDSVPYLYDMFLIANKYASDEDVMLWTNSDMLYFQDMISTILKFKLDKPHGDSDNYLLIGQRHDWYNPKPLEQAEYNNFFEY